MLYISTAPWPFAAQVDIPGLSVTVPYAGRYLVIMSLDVLLSADASNLTRFFLIANGVQQGVYCELGYGSGTGSQGTMTMMWHVVVPVNAVIKAQASRPGGSNTRLDGSSVMSVMWISAS
jgi:hypothetical protein